MCRFLPPLGRHQKWCPNLRYLVFFEIRKNFEKDAKNKIIKIIGCVAFCRLWDGTKSGARISATSCFLKFAKMLKKMQKIEMLKSYRMCRFLTPPGRQQNRTANLRYLVFFLIRKKIEKDETNKDIKII